MGYGICDSGRPIQRSIQLPFARSYIQRHWPAEPEVRKRRVCDRKRKGLLWIRRCEWDYNASRECEKGTHTADRQWEWGTRQAIHLRPSQDAARLFEDLHGRARDDPCYWAR